MSNNSVAEKGVKKFHPGESGFLSLPKEKLPSTYDYPSPKQTETPFCLLKGFLLYSGIKAVFKK